MTQRNQPPGPELSRAATPLGALRREIDAIDDAMHDLMMQRCDVVERLRGLKRDVPAIRPAREAMLLRRLAARHRGGLPMAALVRVWRELFAAHTALQGSFAVAVGAPETDSLEAAALWDLARDQYGSQTPMRAHADPLRVVRAVADGTATLGVLPLPRDGEPAPWWPALATEAEGAPRIVARLPFARRGNARGGAIDALAIAGVAPEPTGDDRSLLVFAIAGKPDRAGLEAAIRRAGISTGALAAEAAVDGGRLVLVELDGFVQPDDARLAAIRDALGPTLAAPTSIGAYAAPIGDL